MKKKKEAVTWHASSKHVSFIACFIALKLSNTHKVMLKHTYVSKTGSYVCEGKQLGK